MKRSNELERVEVPARAAAVAMRRIAPLVRDVRWLFNDRWIERVMLSAYMQGLVDGEQVYRELFRGDEWREVEDEREEYPG